MVLLPNDEETANSSKKHTQFKTRVHKPYPISDQMVEIDTLFQTKTAKKNTPLWRRTYLRSLYKGLHPQGEKRVADYESRCLRKRD